MDAHRSTHTSGQLRDADRVMAPERLGAMHQNRISFVRSLIRKMATEKWQVNQHEWQLCPQGYGHVIYQLKTIEQTYHLIVFCDQLNSEQRNDRVIAQKWDVTFALVQGMVDVALLERLRANVPLQEAGRNPNNVLVLARANKSVRIFEHLINALSQGCQPNSKELVDVGYILRTTAVYGNGKFGIADFKQLEGNPDFRFSFRAQMCAVYLLRQFSLDWVHYLAEQKGGSKAVKLDLGLQRYLGVGNATGLGMAPFLINHPRIVDQWMTTRERALSRVLAMPCDAQFYQPLRQLLDKAALHLEQAKTINEKQSHLNQQAIVDIAAVKHQLSEWMDECLDWQHVVQKTNSMSLEAQEVFLSCLMEMYPHQVDRFQDQINGEEMLSISAGQCVGDLLDVLTCKYRWAIETDYTLPDNNYWFWYRSQDKEEPRLGIRGLDVGEEKALPLDIGRQVNQLFHAVAKQQRETPLAEFLLKKPQYRTIAKRVWTLGHCEMGDIQINVLRLDASPMSLLRCKLAMFGATKFDPRSDRWVRVTLFQGAPLLDEIGKSECWDSWIFPLIPVSDRAEKGQKRIGRQGERG
ncbi:hypothetical protein ACFFUP_11365 [Vibrio ostreicida]|uniref:Zorya protein ZorC EH domain-containing protein n=1 Tax=Vibrio ostreicida TaxID=526588 RepID=A0ABT8BTU1_9VIBR|nr:hypothetical protein [Vibrio ostreicida]MDN3609786.1 hypothetical protein [Vibrio ostreicida]NPD09386.1 hypothetical protein [Vibrio ostreicida]